MKTEPIARTLHRLREVLPGRCLRMSSVSPEIAQAEGLWWLRTDGEHPAQGLVDLVNLTTGELTKSHGDELVVVHEAIVKVEI